MDSYQDGAGVKVFMLDPEHIRLQFEPSNGGVMSADLTATEAGWLVRELSAGLEPGRLPEDGAADE